jgi:CRISPR/Cas system-associated exonuclease Cas4 (RecB family)
VSLKNLAKQVKKEQAKADEPFNLQFLSEIDSYLVKSRVEARTEKNRKKRVAFQPSSYYHCQRNVWYFLNQFSFTDNPTPISERWTEIGSNTHSWIQDDILTPMSKDKRYKLSLVPKEELSVYGKDGIEFITEHQNSPIEIKFVDRRWTKEIPISAMIDGCMNFMGRDFLYEFKTAKHEKYDPLIYPMKDHIKQGAIYSLCLGGLPVMFHYIDKNTQHWKTFFIEYTQEQLDWVVRRINSIEDYYLRGELPPKEESEENCRFCAYKKYCKKDQDKKD